MKELKTIIGLTIFGIIASSFIFLKSNLTDITPDKIRQVKPGMTIEEVLNIIGRPLSIKALRGTHNINCKNPIDPPNFEVNNNTDIKREIEKNFNPTRICCDGFKDDLDSANRAFTFTYTERKPSADIYPMLWVHFDGNYSVYNVYANSYYHQGHSCIYSLAWAIDPKTLDWDKSKTDLIINDKLFYKLFGQ